MSNTVTATSGEIVDRLAASISSSLTAESQEELAKLAIVLTDLSGRESDASIRLAQIAAAALAGNPPNLALAREIREELQRKMPITLKNFVIAWRRSPAAQVVSGLALLLFAAMPVVYYLIIGIAAKSNFFGVDVDLLTMIVLPGAIGSIVSIMVRIDDFDRLKNVESLVLFLTGLFKPIIGISFALFIFAAVKSGLIPLSASSEQSLFFFAALSFVAGFSERFGRDAISATEARMAGMKNA